TWCDRRDDLVSREDRVGHARGDNAGAGLLSAVLGRTLDSRITVVGEEDLIARSEREARQHRVAASRRVVDEGVIVARAAEKGGKALRRFTQLVRQMGEEVPRMLLHAAPPGFLLRQNGARRCPERAVVEESKARVEEPIGTIPNPIPSIYFHNGPPTKPAI